jgi:hypothetical protein
MTVRFEGAPQAPRRQEPVAIDNHHDSDDVGDADELSEHGLIVEARWKL